MFSIRSFSEDLILSSPEIRVFDQPGLWFYPKLGQKGQDIVHGIGSHDILQTHDSSLKNLKFSYSKQSSSKNYTQGDRHS